MSIVAAPCLRFAHAARWNGHAPHRITGVASCRLSHCQLSNCSGRIIEITQHRERQQRGDEQPAAQRRGLVGLGLVGGGGLGRRQRRLVAGGLDRGRRAASGATAAGSKSTVAFSVA